MTGRAWVCGFVSAATMAVLLSGIANAQVTPAPNAPIAPAFVPTPGVAAPAFAPPKPGDRVEDALRPPPANAELPLKVPAPGTYSDKDLPLRPIGENK